MISLKDYTELLRIIEIDIKDADPHTAYNVAKELSVIYLKCTYSISQPNLISRLTSLSGYLTKTCPHESDIANMLLLDIIEKIKKENAA